MTIPLTPLSLYNPTQADVAESNFGLTKIRILEHALMLAGYDIKTKDRIRVADESLNMIIKSLYGEGVQLWQIETINYSPYQPTQITGTDTKIYTCYADHVSASNNKPITGANYLAHWYEEGDVGGVWADAQNYYSGGQIQLADDTLDVISLSYRNSDEDYPDIEKIRLRRFYEIQSKQETGSPTIWTYDSTAKKILFYPQLSYDDYNEYLFTYRRVRRMKDYSGSSDTFEFPAHWLMPLVYSTAAYLVMQNPLLNFDAKISLAREFSGNAVKLKNNLNKVSDKTTGVMR